MSEPELHSLHWRSSRSALDSEHVLEDLTFAEEKVNGTKWLARASISAGKDLRGPAGGATEGEDD